MATKHDSFREHTMEKHTTYKYKYKIYYTTYTYHLRKIYQHIYPTL